MRQQIQNVIVLFRNNGFPDWAEQYETILDHLNQRLMERGHKICFMAEDYLPDINKLPALSCAYEMRMLEQGDFEGLYLPEWSNALCADRIGNKVTGNRLLQILARIFTQAQRRDNILIRQKRATPSAQIANN